MFFLYDLKIYAFPKAKARDKEANQFCFFVFFLVLFFLNGFLLHETKAFVRGFGVCMWVQRGTHVLYLTNRKRCS